jgi:hypothetical protein
LKTLGGAYIMNKTHISLSLYGSSSNNKGVSLFLCGWTLRADMAARDTGRRKKQQGLLTRAEPRSRSPLSIRRR